MCKHVTIKATLCSKVMPYFPINVTRNGALHKHSSTLAVLKPLQQMENLKFGNECIKCKNVVLKHGEAKHTIQCTLDYLGVDYLVCGLSMHDSFFNVQSI
jgi:hypothetical protein